MKLSEQSCILCNRSKLQVRENHPPPMQRAHVIANRFTALEKRYKGVRNAFSDDEWRILLDRFATELNIPSETTLEQARHVASRLYSPMCSECHEEVLSEPIYLPSFLRHLRPHFESKNRIQKMIVLADILLLGIREYNRNKGTNVK